MSDDELDQEVEEAEASEPSSEQDWKKELSKLRNENHSLRTRLRRTEMASEFGADVVEFIPESLPIEEQKALAEKLAAKFGASTAESVQEPTPAPVETEDARLAAISSAPSGGIPAPGIYTAEEAIQLYSTNPGEYHRMRTAGLIKLEKLPGSDKE